MTEDLLIMGKRILMAQSALLYNRELTAQTLAEDWEVRNAQWEARDGALWGTNPRPAPGVIFSRQDFPGNVLVSCRARVVPPSTHDIDVMWNMRWDESKNERGAAYVAGVQGWWDGKVGIEKSPEYKLVAAVACPWFEAGREYFIQAGSVDGHCFVFVDGILRLEVLDPQPINSRAHARVGFEAYQSMISVRQVEVRQIAWEARPQAYTVEF